MREITSKFEFFYGYDHPLSQWYYSDFIIDGCTFNSCEQWMMYSKALLFGDSIKMKQILNEPKANYQRKLGRQVRFFKDEIWHLKRDQIVLKGNLAKFSQDNFLKNYLIGTSEKILAEASPSDLVWGIGLSENNPDRFNVKKWRGKNRLGEILMKVRDEISIMSEIDNSEYFQNSRDNYE